MDRSVIIVVLLLLLLIFLYIAYVRNFKKIVLGAVNLITGGVKTGKSLLSCELSEKEYKKRHKSWWIKKHIFKKDIEEPLFYTNVKMSFGSLKAKKPHKLDKNIRLIELDTLLREKRLAYKSVVYVCESSLLSDNMDYQNQIRNCEMSLFNKLFGHETKGGCLIYDTQSMLDNHYSIKRVLSTYQFIQKNKNFGLFRILYIREMVNGESLASATNNVNEDIDFSVRKYLVWRWWYKRYDCYYYSYLTDNLPVSNTSFEEKKGLVSFNPIYNDIANGKQYKDFVENKKKGEKQNVEKSNVECVVKQCDSK